jgi:plasmid stabilization system protein ParE
MIKYQVITQPDAQQEIRESLAWGHKKWGVAQAQKWAQGIRKAIASLSSFPERYPVAPELEQEQLGDQARQMVFQRYRILFTIKENTVHVLHVRGAYYQDVSEEDEE